MVILRVMGENYIQITGLVATFSACHIATKFVVQHALGEAKKRFQAAVLCYILMPIIAMTCILQPDAARAFQKSHLLRRSKIIIFTVMEVINLKTLITHNPSHISLATGNGSIP